MILPSRTIQFVVAAALLCSAVHQMSAQTFEPRVHRYMKHGAFTWDCDVSAHFQLCFDSELPKDFDRAAALREAEDARSRVLRLASASKYADTIHVFFLASRSRMKELIGFDGEGRSRPSEHAVFYVVGPVGDLTHELSHEIFSNLWGAAEHWIEEGVATWAYKGIFATLECRQMLQDDALIPLDQLVREDWNPSMHPAGITYPELAGFVSFLREKYGLEKLKKVWKGGAASLPRVFGKPLAELETEWRRSLAAPDARGPGMRRMQR